jgi:hypothetical protein
MSETPGPRLLIATGAAAAGIDQLPLLVQRLIESAAEILVITPVLPSRLRWIASDVDRARHEADERLNTVLGHLEAMGSPAQGAVGDETPMTAFSDAVMSFRPDHILVALRATDHDAWQEHKLLDRIRERFHLPMTVFELDHEGRVPASPLN